MTVSRSKITINTKQKEFDAPAVRVAPSNDDPTPNGPVK